MKPRAVNLIVIDKKMLHAGVSHGTFYDSKVNFRA